MTTADTLKDIEELQQRCEQYEGIALKLNWDMLRLPPGAGTEWLVTYEDELLVGFIGLYGFGSEMEVCGMVRPGYRRRGIFSSLWQRAHKVIGQNKAITLLLLNAPASSASAAGFLKNLPVVFDHAEYQMKWDEMTYQLGSGAASSAAASVVLRPAREDETSILIKLDSAGFGISEEDASEMFQIYQKEDLGEHIIIELNGEPAGKMRLATEDNETWIFGLTVEEKLRGLGIGRSALLQTIERERRNYNSVNLEVSLDNPNALKLYESCGFVILNKQDYYRYTG